MRWWSAVKPDTFFVALKILDGEGEIVFKCGRGGMEGRAECLETTDTSETWIVRTEEDRSASLPLQQTTMAKHPYFLTFLPSFHSFSLSPIFIFVRSSSLNGFPSWFFRSPSFSLFHLPSYLWNGASTSTLSAKCLSPSAFRRDGHDGATPETLGHNENRPPCSFASFSDADAKFLRFQRCAHFLLQPNPSCIAPRPRHHATLVLSPLSPSFLPSSLAFSIYFLWQQKQLRSPLSHSAAAAAAKAAAGRSPPPSSSSALSLSTVTASTPKRVAAAAAAFGHITLSSRYIWRRLWLQQ